MNNEQIKITEELSNTYLMLIQQGLDYRRQYDECLAKLWLNDIESDLEIDLNDDFIEILAA